MEILCFVLISSEERSVLSIPTLSILFGREGCVEPSLFLRDGYTDLSGSYATGDAIPSQIEHTQQSAYRQLHCFRGKYGKHLRTAVRAFFQPGNRVESLTSVSGT